MNPKLKELRWIEKGDKQSNNYEIRILSFKKRLLGVMDIEKGKVICIRTTFHKTIQFHPQRKITITRAKAKVKKIIKLHAIKLIKETKELVEL